MIHVKGDIWEALDTGEYDVLLVTTNGTVKKNGCGVMGRGIAREARDRMLGVDQVLGDNITKYGLTIELLGYYGTHHVAVYSFPVKHNWWENADIELIERILKDLKDMLARAAKDIKVILPRPGVGNGKLSWEDKVFPLMEKVGLPDNVYVFYK